MAIGQTRSFAEGLASVKAKLKQNPMQFGLAVILVMACGATKKFFTFPMPWIAGQSDCMKSVSSTPDATYMAGYSASGKTYTPTTWLETKSDCKEKAEVFVFVTEKFTITTANLVFFGVGKAVFNFITGVTCDTIGRKWAIIIGWCCAIPMPFMVIYASNWWVVATSNIFLGMQQALVWSATIFIMIDYLGQENSGIAIGINETVGYTTIAIVTEIAAYIMDENYPRTTNYYVVIGIIFGALVLSVVFLRESKQVAVGEEAERTKRDPAEVAAARTTSLIWASGRHSKIEVARSAFVYTSFINVSLITICFAGLMINFISGFVWSLMKKWMKGGEDGVWEALDKQTIADVVLCYGILKGTLQWIFGFAGDRYGRKYFISGGLFICAMGLVMMSGVGVNQSDPRAGFYIAALLIGFGTAMMYSNCLAAICDHADPSWRSSALGAYRFWRDLGYAIGALVTGAVADWVGIPWSIGFTAILTALAGLLVFLFYEEVSGDDMSATFDKPPMPVIAPMPAAPMPSMAAVGYSMPAQMGMPYGYSQQQMQMQMPMQQPYGMPYGQQMGTA